MPSSKNRSSFSIVPFSKIISPFLYDLVTKVFTNSSKPSLLKGNSLLKNKDNLSASLIFKCAFFLGSFNNHNKNKIIKISTH